MHTDVDPGSPVDRPTHQGSAPAHLAAAVTAAKCGQGRGVDYRYWRITPRPRTVGGVRWPTFAAVGPARTSGSLPAAARGTARRCPTASPAPWSSPLCIPFFSSAASAPRPSVAPSGLTTGCSILGCTPSSTELHAATACGRGHPPPCTPSEELPSYCLRACMSPAWVTFYMTQFG